MFRSVAAFILLGLASCSTQTRILLPQEPQWSPFPGTTTATFRIPRGWSALQSGQERLGWGIAPTGQRGLHVCTIVLDYYLLDPDQPLDAQGQAESYLEATHRHADDKVTMEISDSFDGGRNGRLSVYRYYSDYWRDRRAVFIIRGRRYVHVELNAHESTDAERCQPILEQVARSVIVR
jgi:hypothetical protein